MKPLSISQLVWENNTFRTKTLFEQTHFEPTLFESTQFEPTLFKHMFLKFSFTCVTHLTIKIKYQKHVFNI